MNAPTFRIFVDGQETVFTEAKAKVKFVSLGAEFKAADDALTSAKDTHLGRAVVFGAFLLQLQQHLPWDRIVAWSKSELRIGHTQKLYSAMDLAEAYAEERGVLDEPRLVVAIRSFNANCAARGLKPLDERSRSIRTAEIAAGLRPGIPDRRLTMTAPRTGEKNASGAPEGKKSPVSAGLRVDILDGPEVLDLHIKPVEPRVVGGVAGVGGQQTTPSSVLLNRRAVEVNGGGPDSVSFLRPGRERDAGVSPASHGLPPALESRQRVQPSAQGNAAAPAGMRETSRPAVGGGGQGQASRHLGIEASRAIQAHAGDQRATQPVQLTLAGEYELAAKKATLLVERIASGHASPEIVRKLIALCEEAERGEMVAGGGR